jgi:hypothetical protein
MPDQVAPRLLLLLSVGLRPQRDDAPGLRDVRAAAHRDTLSLMLRRTWRVCAGILLAFLTFDLVDGVLFPEADASRAADGYSLQAPAPEFHDAEFCCARATVGQPVFVARLETAPAKIDAPAPVRMAYGFLLQPFHPPKPSL